ncbi:MAG: prolyl oligopeptidase family serine peptidase [Candidatus Latescibacterota bacterium]|nr:prolyl oligopeptidase family serine peptidase [Candidatus Latescibacterota bacterium]
MAPDDVAIYQLPPQEIVDLVDAPPTPSLGIDPQKTCLVLMHRPSLPPIEEVGRLEVRLAGLRIDPKTNGPSRASYFTGYTIRDMARGTDLDVTGLPEDARLGQIRFSPNGSYFAFSAREAKGLSLWVVDVVSGVAKRLTSPRLNSVLGGTFTWLSDGKHLVCRLIPQDRPLLRTPIEVPVGPVLQENLKGTAPSRTYQDLLKNPDDEAAFEYYGLSQLAVVSLDASLTKIGEPGLHVRSVPSPDGQYLLVETLHRPFSYLVPYYRFPVRVQILDIEGRLVRDVVDLPLAENVPIAFDAVPVGPRAFEWRADADAEVVWVEAQDEGDPAKEVTVRDRAYAISAPFDADARVIADFELRHIGFSWGRGDLALARERRWRDRRLRIWRIQPERPKQDSILVFDRSYEDRYSDPGAPLQEWSGKGTRVLMADGESLFLAGDGASPEGDRPFIDRFDLSSGDSERLTQSEPPVFERAIQIVSSEGPTILVSREREDEPTNFYIRDLASGDLTALTQFEHPYPQLKDAKKELIKYQREDGVQLTAMLHSPPGYDPSDGPIPTVLWAYPREFKSADAAGQVKDSPHRFARLSPHSPLYLLALGYAVMDGPTMPIIGEGIAHANDTYVEQLVASAKAAVNEVVSRGISDGDRIGVGGHSYGGFMTANLLARSSLFRVGVALSGAYNRTLTPFGFQAEERSLWQAPDTYAEMSPFMHADKIESPLLLIHGEADNNSGTFPMQSERFYNALRGHGVPTRLVMLPHESHGYRARESILHMLYEITTWFDKYLRK